MKNSADWRHVALAMIVLLMVVGCGARKRSLSTPAASSLRNTLKLGDEMFVVDDCTIWGYLFQSDDKWHCHWCIDADALPRTFTELDEDELYTYEVKPSLMANTVPIQVTRWRDLDGVRFQTGKDNQDQTALYLLTCMTSAETCTNNVVEITHVTDDQFRVRWRGDAYLHGVDGESFELDAIATLTKVTLTNDLEAESDVDNEALERIFATVFPHGDFQQHPAELDRYEEDGVVYLSTESKFTPRMTPR